MKSLKELFQLTCAHTLIRFGVGSEEYTVKKIFSGNVLTHTTLIKTGHFILSHSSWNGSKVLWSFPSPTFHPCEYKSEELPGA